MRSHEIPPTEALNSARFGARLASLQLSVNAAAQLLHERGIRPTVMRVRAALGGGSPNYLAPALKHWKDTIFPTLPLPALAGERAPMAPLPTQVADLAREIWQRATAAAAIELQSGKMAAVHASRGGEVQALRIQITALRNQYEREATAYGELRIQAARNEALMREALANARDAEARERELLRETGSSRQKVAELQAHIDELSRRLARSPPPRRRRQVDSHRKGKKPLASSRKAQLVSAASQKLRKAARARKKRPKPKQRRSRPL